MTAVIRNFVRPTIDGREAEQNRERYYWQSHMTKAGRRAELPSLTDIHTLAAQVRHEAATTATIGIKPTAALAFADAMLRIFSHARRAATPTESSRRAG